MKAYEFVLGYAIPGIVLGILQAAICIVCGAILAAITSGTYFGIGAAALLALSQMPMLIICVFGGILFGSILSDKAAPGVSSILISSAGILGGCWMPLDVMGKLETICRFLPFYPSVYWGRIITGALHTQTGETALPYVWDSIAALGTIPIAVFAVAAIALSFVAFGAQMQEK